MCECCSQHASDHREHVHVNLTGPEHANRLQGVLEDVPGVICCQYSKENGTAKVEFDGRIIDRSRLGEILSGKGFA